MSNIYRSQFGLIADINGVTFEVVQFGSDWAINSIPTAEIILAVGRLANNGITAAAVHSNLSKITAEAVAKVYFCPSGDWSTTKEWPEGPHLIFEGKVVNSGYTKVGGKVSFVIRLIHWLGDMDYSSAVSSLSHPSNPTDYTFHAIMGSMFKSGVTPGKPAGIAGTSGAEILTADNIQDDLWGKALKPFFCTLGKNLTTILTSELKDCFAIEDNDNSEALAALSRIEGESDDACSMPLSCYTPKLSFDFVGASGTTVAEAISKAICFDSIQSYVSTTLWGKLIGITSTFGAAIIPQVDKALVVPFVPGIRGTYCKSIEICDYNFVNMVAARNQLLRGIVLMGDIEMMSGLTPTSSRGIASLAGAGGCYAPAGVESGMLKFVPPPPWLQNIPYSGHSAKRPIGLDGKLAFSSVTTPKEVADARLVANKDGKHRDEIITDTSELFDRYAMYMYMVETLRGRFGTISGKLRFDISPGSNITIAGSAERFLNDTDALSHNVVANVMRVSIGINAESSMAGTTFTLSHIRTEAENEDDKFSVDNHPLYNTAFYGAPLVDALWFKSEGDSCC